MVSYFILLYQYKNFFLNNINFKVKISLLQRNKMENKAIIFIQQFEKQQFE